LVRSAGNVQIRTHSSRRCQSGGERPRSLRSRGSRLRRSRSSRSSLRSDRALAGLLARPSVGLGARGASRTSERVALASPSVPRRPPGKQSSPEQSAASPPMTAPFSSDPWFGGRFSERRPESGPTF
jgi:hypothetical protein